MACEEVPCAVTPAKAGVQKCMYNLDSGFRRNDRKGHLECAVNLTLLDLDHVWKTKRALAKKALTCPL